MVKPAELFTRYRTQGDIAALGQIFDQTAPRLLSLAMSLCADVEDAEDVLQATFVIAMKKADSFDGNQPLEPWLAGILGGEVCNARRRRARRVAEEVSELAHDDPGPVDLAENEELVQMLRRDVRSLPLEQRQVILLQLQHGLQPAEIAEVLELAPGTVRMRIHRGICALRRSMNASLSILLGSAFATRGLAAVRRSVLSEARQLTVASSPVAVLGMGVLSMKKLVFVIAIVFLFSSLAVMGLWSPDTPRLSQSEPAGVPVGSAVSPVPTGTGLRQPTEEPAAKREPLSAEHGAIFVRVLGEDNGFPVRGLRVEVTPDRDDHRAETLLGLTDDLGQVRFDALPATEYRIQLLRGSGSRACVEKAVKIPADSEVTVDLTVPDGGTVTGKTVDDSGRSIPYAWVLLATTGINNHRSSGNWRFAGQSNESGQFELPLVSGENQIAARHDGHAPSHAQKFSPASGEIRSVTVVLPASRGALHGVVTDDDGSPIEGAAVTAHYNGWFKKRAEDGSEVYPYAPVPVISDDRGNFEFKSLSSRLHRLVVEAPGYAGWQGSARVDAETITRKSIVLRRAATLIGIVVDATGRPICGARVRLQSQRHLSSLTTDEAGAFRSEGLPPGSFAITVTKHGEGRCESSSVLAAGKQSECRLQLEREPGILGRLVDESGVPVVGRELVAREENWNRGHGQSRARRHTTTTGMDGGFSLPDLGEYSFELLAKLDVGPPVSLAKQVETSPMHRTFVLNRAFEPSAAVAARIVDTAGQPVPEVWIALLRGDEPEESRIKAGPEGNLSISPLPPGTYRIRIVVPDFLSRTDIEFSLERGQARDLGDLRLSRGGRLIVNLLDEHERPWSKNSPALYLSSGDKVVCSLKGKGSQARTRPVIPGIYRLGINDHSLFAWPVDVELFEGKEASTELQILHGTWRRLRFLWGATSGETRLRYEVRTLSGRLVKAGSVRLRDEKGCDMGVALLAGDWTVTGETDAGVSFSHTLKVADLSPVEDPVVIPIVGGR